MRRDRSAGVMAPVPQPSRQGEARVVRGSWQPVVAVQMKKFLKPVAWSSPSLVMLIATALVVWHVVDTFDDATLRWTAITAVLTAAALLVAVIGLPLAVYQLVALDRDLVRPNQLRTRLVEYRRVEPSHPAAASAAGRQGG